jgi:hypothetical protein
LLEAQKAGRLADNPKRQSLVGGGLERATMLFLGFQRAEPFGGYEVEKKSGENFLLGKFSFARAFRNGIRLVKARFAQGLETAVWQVCFVILP